jgi:hypothetical protein
VHDAIPIARSSISEERKRNCLGDGKWAANDSEFAWLIRQAFDDTSAVDWLLEFFQQVVLCGNWSELDGMEPILATDVHSNQFAPILPCNYSRDWAFLKDLLQFSNLHTIHSGRLPSKVIVVEIFPDSLICSCGGMDNFTREDSIESKSEKTERNCREDETLLAEGHDVAWFVDHACGGSSFGVTC